MKSATGRWVSGDDFFNRQKELVLLKSRIRDGNHILLTGQRRMGKTSLAQEVGRRLRAEGWVRRDRTTCRTTRHGFKKV